MKVLLILVFFTFVQLNLAQDFDNLLKQVKNDVTDSQKRIQEKVVEREKNLPKFTEGSLGDYASRFIKSSKSATTALTQGVRNTATGITRALISTTLNTGVSLLLNEFKLISDTTGIGRQLSLPDVSADAYGFSVKASNGYFSSLSSLEKYERINVTIVDAETLLIDVPVRFNEMKIGYNNLSVSTYLISTSGSFSVNVEKNSIKISLRLGLDTSCALSVERVTIEELAGITVKLEGLGGYASMLTERLTNYIISWLQNNIAYHIQTAVDNNLKSALGHNPMICSNFVSTK